MLFIHRPQTDPYFNLAAEEYFLKNLDQDCFMLWINEPSVVVGKHQNAFAEINPRFVKEHRIPVVRRITGGGTVFHDPGNLNFSFISKGEKDKLVDFRRFMQPVIDYLISLGLPARFEGKNDIRINGLKVSGNAEHVHRDKVLHHGTLLFSSELGILGTAIRGREALFHDKAVRSVRSPVANISDLLDDAPTLDEFRLGIAGHLSRRSEKLQTTCLTATDVEAIHRLAEEKYRTWDWNYGYSPAFSFVKSIQFGEQEVRISLRIRNGIIIRAEAEGPAWISSPISSIAGVRFDEESLKDHYQNTAFQDVLSIERYRELFTLLLD